MQKVNRMTPDTDPSQLAQQHFSNTDFAGAIALLRDCVAGQAGQRLLIVSEESSDGFYDEQAPKQTAAAGRALGMHVYEMQAKSFFNDESEKAILLNSLIGFDHIVFFSRVGDQIRFSQDLNLPSSTMCYTLNRDALNSHFGTACHHGMQEIKQAIDRALEGAAEIKVTCPHGTDFTGRPDWSAMPPIEVSLKRFPLLVPRPVTAMGFKGRVALSRFLVGTGSRHYEPYYLPLPKDVYAIVDNGRIMEFEGDKTEVARVESHYQHVSKLFSIDPWCVDSWHAGIHPGCHFASDAQSDILRWSGTAFGNPRILHFHTCGQYAPGEISWNILDPTVCIDGEAVWEDGQLFPDRLPGGQQVLDRHPNLAQLFENPVREIGLGF